MRELLLHGETSGCGSFLLGGGDQMLLRVFFTGKPADAGAFCCTGGTRNYSAFHVYGIQNYIGLLLGAVIVFSLLA